MKYKAWSKQEQCVCEVVKHDWYLGEITVLFKDGCTMMDDESEFIIIELGE